jgi:hypothetical protein
MLKCGERFETITQFPMHQWLLDSHYTYAVALSANAVVVANGMQTKSEKMAAHWLSNVPAYVPDTFTLQACDRQTGKVLWQHPLPSEPVLDGISIARDGSVVVQMLDGGVLCFGK